MPEHPPSTRLTKQADGANTVSYESVLAVGCELFRFRLCLTVRAGYDYPTRFTGVSAHLLRILL